MYSLLSCRALNEARLCLVKLALAKEQTFKDIGGT